MKLFPKRDYYRWRYNSIGDFIEAQFIDENGYFGHEITKNYKKIGIPKEKIVLSLKDNDGYKWQELHKQTQ